MQEESIVDYIRFGTVLRYLQDTEEGRPIRGSEYVEENLEAFLGGLDVLGLTVTLNLARRVKLPEMLQEFESADVDATLTDPQADRLAAAVNDLRMTLEAESAEKKAFVTAPKRWDVDRLLAEPGALFGEGVFDGLDAQSAYDFSEACKCIAFERSTAAAFHMLRGTEAVLRRFYCHVVRQRRLPEKQRMWGPMVAQMRKKSKPPPKALLDNLDAIRLNFRNPTQHPDEIYSIDQAQDLLGLVVPAVNSMAGEIAT